MTSADAKTVPAARAPLIVGVILLALAALSLFDSFRVAAGTGPGVGPSVALKLVGVLLGVLGVAHLATAWGRRAERTALAADDRLNPVALAWVLGGLVVQIAALAFGAGFIVSATILFACTARGFGRPLLSRGPLYGLALSAIVYGFFTKVLSLSLPAGPLERLVFG